MASSSGQREHPRVKPAAGRAVEVHIMGAGFLEVLAARDISVGGIGVFVPHDFGGCDIDDPVDLIVKLGQDRSFVARGVIRHTSRTATDHFFGVQFTDLSDENAEKIRKYVERRLAEGGGI